MRGSKTIVAVLTVMALAVLTAAPALAVAVGPYDVTFVTMRYDFPNPGYSTWYYAVESTCDEKEISHTVFELGDCCDVLDAGVWTDLDTLESWWGTGNITVNRDPTTQTFGIKFDVGIEECDTHYYYFTVEGNHALEEEGITVAIKTGGGPVGLLMQGTSMLAAFTAPLTRALGILQQTSGVYTASVYGPDLDCEETTAVALTSFSAASAAGPAVSWLLATGGLLAALAPISFAVARRLGWGR